MCPPPDLGSECGPLDQHRGRCLHPLRAVGPGHPFPAGPSALDGAEHQGQVLLLPGEPLSCLPPPWVRDSSHMNEEETVGQEPLVGESQVRLQKTREGEGQEPGSGMAPTTSGVGGCRSSFS